MLVHNKGEYVRHIGTRLEPGMNELPEKEAVKFTVAFENPLNKHLLQDGEIEIFKDQEDSSPAFNQLTADRAIELIKATSDITLLEEFRADEASNKNRKTVLEAIGSQVAALNQPYDEEPFIDGQE